MELLFKIRWCPGTALLPPNPGLVIMNSLIAYSHFRGYFQRKCQSVHSLVINLIHNLVCKWATQHLHKNIIRFLVS